MSDAKRPWTLDSSTRASHPGGVRVNPFRWLVQYPMWPLVWFFGAVFSAVVARIEGGDFWFATASLVAGNLVYWQRVREHFLHGCANPAVIVSIEPMLIAVSTDLSKGTGQYPAIKIIQKSLKTVCGQVPQVGARLVTVSVYQRGLDANLPCWVDFDPRPVEGATADQDSIQRVMSSLSDDEWKQLDSALRQVSEPLQCGLFLLEAGR